MYDFSIWCKGYCPSRLPDAVTQVNFLAVDKEARIETPNILKHVPSDKHTGTVDPVNIALFVVVTPPRMMSSEKSRDPVQAMQFSQGKKVPFEVREGVHRPLQRSIGVQMPRTHAADSGALGQSPRQSAQCRGQDNRIRIQE
jgi:hypothetical protein